MAPLISLPGVLADKGLDPASVIRDAGCDIGRFADADNTIEFSDLGRLIVRAVDATGCPHLGLEIGRRTGLSALGAIGQAAASAADLGSALRLIALYLHLHDRGAVVSLKQWGDLASIGYVLHLPDVPGVGIIYDGVLSILQEVLRSLAGAEWRPSEVHLCRSRPADVSAYRDEFGAPLHFGSGRSALVFPARELERSLVSADSGAFATATAEFDEMARLTGTGYAERVRRLLRRLLIVEEIPEHARLAQVAQLLGLHPRTLNRRLRDEETSFKGLIAEARFEIARQLLRDTHLPIIEVAGALGYGDATAFSRAFRCAAGVSPSAWRSRHSLD